MRKHPRPFADCCVALAWFELGSSRLHCAVGSSCFSASALHCSYDGFLPAPYFAPAFVQSALCFSSVVFLSWCVLHFCSAICSCMSALRLMLQLTSFAFVMRCSTSAQQFALAFACDASCISSLALLSGCVLHVSSAVCSCICA